MSSKTAPDSGRDAVKTTPSRPGRLMRVAVPWMFLAPALITFFYFKFYPIAHGVYLSFFDVAILGDNRWIGIENFLQAAQDTVLRMAFWHTVAYVVVTVLLSAVLAFVVALALQGTARHLRILRTAIFLPAVTSVAVVVELWRILYHPTANGIFNTLLGTVGLGPFDFVADPGMSLASIIVMSIWRSVPYDMVIFIAGLVGVDKTLYEAASIDGAGPMQRTWYVTIPQVSFTFTIVIVLGIIRSFRVFAEVYAMTGGGPARSTEVLMTYIYRVGFVDFDIGYAAALSTLLFMLTAVLTILGLKLRGSAS